MAEYTRKVCKCYLVKEDHPYAWDTIKICSSKELAEHYVRLLSPKWKAALGVDLTVQEDYFYEDLTRDEEVKVLIEEPFTSIVNVCKKYNIPLKDLPGVLEEYITQDNIGWSD